jgi:glycosyltransferase involved in cell wall biosynthesis
MDFLVFAPNPWHDLWRNRQQIFSRLAARHKVLYVEPARASLADWRRGRVPWAQIRRPAVVQEQPNLWLYRIPALLPTRATGGLFDRTADSLLAIHLGRTIQRAGFLSSPVNHSPFTIHHSQFSPILWLYRPTHWRWAAANFPHSLLVYHITDDYAAFGHLNDAQRAALLAEERDLLAAADLAIVTAPRLLELKAPYAHRIELVTNGVDAEVFQRALTAPRLPAISDLHPAPCTLQPAIRLGYSGHVSARLDLPLLRAIALARPDWQLLFAGSEWDAGCAEELKELKVLPNVHFLGLLPVEDVPAFIVSCDVCLIPYRVNDETRAISSLKLYEYLAAGKPVVSARVPAAEEHAVVVRTADPTVGSWVEQIGAALAERNDPVQVAARQAVAGENTWEERVARIESLLANLQRSAA